MRQSVTPWLVSALLQLPALQAAPGPVLAAADHYELRVKLDPAAQHLEVNGTLTPRIRQASTRELTWQLNRNLQVVALTGPLVAGWTFSQAPNAQEAGLLKVRFRRPVGPGDKLIVKINYKGTLAQASGPNQITPAWTELGRPLLWVPTRAESEPFTFHLEVQGKPDLALASYGPFKGGRGLRTLDWNRPVTELVVVAAPAERLRTWSPAPQVRLVAADLGEASATRLADAMGKLMASLQKRLGPLEAASMTLIQAGRPNGGSYLRPGLIVLDALTEARVAEGWEELLHTLALETARAWWRGAPVTSWEDWLNESFAEHSALLALRDVVGEQAYQRRIEAKRRACEGLPALWQFDRGSQKAKPIMENKGVVILAELEGFVGRERFQGFCQALTAQKVARTSAFLDLLEAREGKPVREAFQRRIMAL